MDAGEQQDIVWTYRWDVRASPPGIAAWLVDDGGAMEPTQATFFAFQIREASVRASASIPKFSSGARRDLRFAEPPEHFMEVTGGEHNLANQEIFLFCPAATPVSERMPWFRIGVNVFFHEDEARQIAQERRQAVGTEIAVAAAAAAGPGRDGPDFEPE